MSDFAGIVRRKADATSRPRSNRRIGSSCRTLLHFPTLCIALICLQQMNLSDHSLSTSVMGFVVPYGALPQGTGISRQSNRCASHSFWNLRYGRREINWRIMSKQDDGPLYYDDFENYNAKNERENGDNPDEDDDDEDEDDDDVLASNDQMLGDWRSFRRRLAANERKSSPSASAMSPPLNHPSNSSTVSNNGKNSDASTTPQRTGQTTVTTKTSRNSKMKSPNEILLAQQNEKLALEYHNDVWAHEIATVRDSV